MDEEIKGKWDEMNIAMRRLSHTIEEAAIAFGKVWKDIYDLLKPTLDMFAEWFERERRARLYALLPLWIPDRGPLACEVATRSGLRRWRQDFLVHVV